ncbi:MAG: hypothetical protein V2J10_05475 [Wenzhouxiangella sp.]|jgi:hypothetical protein|nr:hypothetical protein [Wenzhouxiangella sp.]
MSDRRRVSSHPSKVIQSFLGWMPWKTVDEFRGLSIAPGLLLALGFSGFLAAEDPELVMPGAVATDFFIDAPRIHYLNRPECAPARNDGGIAEPVAQQIAGTRTARGVNFVSGSTRQVIGRSAVTGMNPREIYADFHDTVCAPPDTPDVLSNIVSDGSFIYWISGNANALVRVPVDRMIWQTNAPEVVAAHDARRSDLVIDDGLIYVLETRFGGTGLYRINPSNGAKTNLLNASQVGSTPFGLQTDGIYLLWRHGTSGSVLRRYTIGAGNPTDIVSSVTAFRSAFPEVGLGVYVAQGNVLRNYSHASGSLSAPLHTGAANVIITDINVDSGAWYFIEATTGVSGAYALYRKPFGQPAVAIFSPPAGSETVGSLARHDRDLYFLHGTDLKRLPVDAGAVSRTNLRIDDLEITQAIQNEDNDIALIRGKRTVVRLFASSDEEAVAGVQAHLYRVNGAGNAIDGPLFPVNLERAALFMRVPEEPDRDNINDSFTFLLPPDWVADTQLRLRAELNPYRYPLEPDYADNVLTTSFFTIEESARLETRFILFEYEDSAGNRFRPRLQEDYVQTVSWIRRTYPLASEPGGAAVGTPGFRPNFRYLFDEDLGDNVNSSGLPPADTECGRRARLDPKDEEFLSAQDRTSCAARYVVCPSLNTLRAVEGLSLDVVQVGMVADDIGFPRGLACGSANVMTPSGSGDFGWDSDGSYADWYGGHELGHAQGRGHPSQGNAECRHSASDPDFPWVGAQIGGSGYRGFDVGAPGINPALTPRVYSREWHDFMSYCSAPGQWISDYTFEGIRDFGASRVADNRVPRGGAFVQISGVIDPDTHNAYVAELRRWDSLGFAPVSSLVGPYRVRFLNPAGDELAFHDVSPHLDDDGEVLILSEFLPYASGTAEIEIVHRASGHPSWHFEVSGNAPAVSDVAVNLGTQELSWSASDADGDSLSYDVLFSSDGGLSWRGLSLNLEDRVYPIDVELLPGPQGRFRIIANDGFHQGQGDSPDYAIPANPPVITLLSPAPGQEFAFEQEVVFSADVSSLDDADSISVSWRDQTGFELGTGTEFSQNDLIIGENIITVTATDSDGLEAARSFVIFVNDSLERPGPTLTVGPDSVGWHVGPEETALQSSTITVGNSGSGSFWFTATSDASWLLIERADEKITLSVDPSNFEPGTFVTTELVIRGISGGPEQTIVVPVSLAKGFIPQPVLWQLFRDRFEQR